MNDFIKEECCNCGVIFAVSAQLKQNWKNTKRTFYCPNGHPQHYIKSTADCLREQLVDKEREIASLHEQVRSLSKPKRKTQVKPAKDS